MNAVHAARLGCATLAAALVASGCREVHTTPPAGQIVVHVDTDAPIARAATEATPGWDEPAPLFDRLHVDLYPPEATAPCDGCSNEFTVSREDFDSLGVSFGLVIPAGDAGWTARVRLTKELFELSTGDIDPETTIDAWVALPVVVDSQIDDVSVVLETDATGVPAGSLQAPIAPTPGAPPGSKVGTWSPAQRVNCTTDAPPGAVCVPGGAFWMGASSAIGLVPGASRTWRRLVVLSPFWIGATEVTALAARTTGISVLGVARWDTSTAGTSEADYCTYSTTPSSRDPLPLNCVSWQGANAFCLGLGGTLPSEAQLEYAAGGAFGHPYPWGEDPPSCTDAIWGRDGYGLYYDSAPMTCLDPSNFMAPMGGPEPPGTGTRDALVLPGGVVSDSRGQPARAGRRRVRALDRFLLVTIRGAARSGVRRRDGRSAVGALGAGRSVDARGELPRGGTPVVDHQPRRGAGRRVPVRVEGPVKARSTDLRPAASGA